MRRFVLIWPESHHNPTSIDLATEEEIDAIGGFSWDKINEAQESQTSGWLGDPFVVDREDGASVTFLEVNDRIAITDRLREGAAKAE